jgi:hypothetical protein
VYAGAAHRVAQRSLIAARSQLSSCRHLASHHPSRQETAAPGPSDSQPRQRRHMGSRRRAARPDLAATQSDTAPPARPLVHTVSGLIRNRNRLRCFRDRGTHDRAAGLVDRLLLRGRRGACEVSRRAYRLSRRANQQRGAEHLPVLRGGPMAAQSESCGTRFVNEDARRRTCPRHSRSGRVDALYSNCQSSSTQPDHRSCARDPACREWRRRRLRETPRSIVPHWTLLRDAGMLSRTHTLPCVAWVCARAVPLNRAKVSVTAKADFTVYSLRHSALAQIPHFRISGVHRTIDFVSQFRCRLRRKPDFAPPSSAGRRRRRACPPGCRDCSLMADLYTITMNPQRSLHCRPTVRVPVQVEERYALRRRPAQRAHSPRQARHTDQGIGSSSPES